jgi:hypothetical protein
MKVKISRIVKSVQTIRELAELIGAVIDHKRFDAEDVLNIEAKTNRIFYVSNIEELSHENLQSYTNLFLEQLSEDFPASFKEFLYDSFYLKDKVLSKLKVKWDWKE